MTIPSTVTSIENYAFNYCNDLADVYSYITDLTNVSMGAAVFMTRIFTNRTLHVPHGTADAYHADENWYPYFSSIVEMDPAADLPGDVNGNGEVNIADVNAVFDIILGKTGYTADADVNNDGEITIADANEIIDIILGNGSSQSDPGYVDLGLPSGTLWATCNVGAESPEQYGDYFAWGETQPKDVYSWENYQWCNGTEYSLTKYNNSSDYGHVDKKMELDPDDDAAYVNQGPSWRMPSLEQIQELCNCCTWKWFQLNGVNGQLVTGPNGKSIFLPAAGGRSSQLYNTGVSSYYWTRTLCSRDTLTIESAGPGQAYIQFFRSGEWEVWYSSRYVGNTVRAVRAPQK